MTPIAREPEQRPVLTPTHASVLRAEGIAKAFGPTQAIVNASLELRAGEVHCLVGENGSGKSTLVKILAGVHRPDAGEVRVGDGATQVLRSPQAALRAGISTVFQEVLVVEPRSVVENVWLGVDGLFRRTRSADEKRGRAAEVLNRLLAEPLPLDLPVGALSLSDRQACSIARALVREPKVLILDEATSALDVETRDRLFGVVRDLASSGTATIFISHRMDEISEIGDRCTVMRSGETVATLERREVTAAALVRLMTASDHLAPAEVREEAAARHVTDRVVMRTAGLRLRPDRAPIDFELRAGELVGLAGLEGHGQDAFINALWGMGPPAVFVGDELVTTPKRAAALGVGYVPKERRAESIFESKSIRENFAAATFQSDVRAGLLWPSLSRERLQHWVGRLGIKMGGPEDLITSLSGGNQQKVIIARWLAMNPRVLLLNDPTRGVDIGTKRDLYRVLVDLARDGVAVAMVSSEVDEHVELMDRVLVFREHEVARELSRAELNRQSLVAAYFGAREQAGALPHHTHA